MSNSRRISQFNNDSLLQDGDLFTLVRSNTNLNIRYSDFKLSLGVSGTLSTTGDQLGAQILDNSTGTDYKIRNLESTKGIAVTLSAENGVNIATDFTQTGVGQKIINDVTADQLAFKTLLSGNNITITDSGNSLRFDLTGTGGTTKTVTIAEESDFPAAVGGVITLLPDTDYLIVNDITTANRFVTARPNTIRASSSQMVTLTYTGVDTMFTSVDPSFKISNITINAPNGHIFSSTAPTLPGVVQMVESNVKSCQTLGTIDGNFITRFTNIAFEGLVAGGLTFAGANQILVVNVGVAFLGGGSLIDLGTSTFQAISIENGFIPSSAPGTFFLSGLSNSGNLIPGGLATVSGNKGFGSGSSLNGISVSDVRWEFSGNNTIPDTVSDGLMSTQSNALVTAITTISVPVKVNAVWTLGTAARFDFDSSGRLTFVGERAEKLPIDITASILGATGGDKQASMCLAINGSIVTATCQETTVNSTKAGTVSLVWQHNFTNGDYVEVFVTNETDTVDLVVTQSIVRIN